MHEIQHQSGPNRGSQLEAEEPEKARSTLGKVGD